MGVVHPILVVGMVNGRRRPLYAIHVRLDESDQAAIEELLQSGSETRLTELKKEKKAFGPPWLTLFGSILRDSRPTARALCCCC